MLVINFLITYFQLLESFCQPRNVYTFSIMDFSGIFIYQLPENNNSQPTDILNNDNMIASLENNAAITLKPGAVLTVTGANNENDAKREVADFLASSERSDLGYFLISKDYFLLYLKSGSSAHGIA